MSAPVLERPSITCGRCKATHHSVDEVRRCYGTTPARPTERVLRPGDVPAGRYAIVRLGETEFYKVDRPTDGKWRGYTFVTRLAGDNEWPVRNRQSREDVLHIIGQDVRGALQRYGREIGECGVCGRTLTDAASRTAGIGPVCANKF